MGIRLRQAIILVLLLLITAIYLNGTRLLEPVGVNSTLSDLHYLGPNNSWNSFLFGDRKHWSSMRNYVSLLSEYDHRRNFGLLNPAGEAAYLGRFSNLANDALNSWQQYQFREMGIWVSHEIDDYFGLESLRKSHSPVLLVGLVAAAYTGKTLRYRLDSENQLETRTSMSQAQFEQQYLGWKNQSLATSIGATLGTSGTTLTIQKQLSPGVSVKYDHGTQQTIGVSYSRGF